MKASRVRRKAGVRWSVIAVLLAAPHLALAAASACGVVTEPADWTRGDEHGDLSVTGEAECRSLGARIILRYATEDEALAALAHGAIDAAAGITPSPDRVRQYGVVFRRPFLLDEVIFIVRRGAGIRERAGLSGRMVCFIAGEAGEAATLDAAHAGGGAIIPSPFEEEGEMGAALAGGRCAAIAGMRSRLAALVDQFGASRFTVLPGRMGEVPAAVAMRAARAKPR